MVYIVQCTERYKYRLCYKKTIRVKMVERVRICEAERMRPFHLVEHGRIVVVRIVLVRTALVVGFGTDLSVVVDDHLPVADLTLPAAHHGGTIR